MCIRDSLQTGGMGELDGRSGHAAARALDEHGVAPVSYTHLDVYKRQGLPF